MLEDYCVRLQELNKQKNQFLKLKCKTSTKDKLLKQENKYHRYILSQITYKNKLYSLVKFNLVFDRVVRRQTKAAFDIFNRSANSLPPKCVQVVQKDSSLSSQQKNQIKNVAEEKLNIYQKRLKQTACKSLIKWVKNKQQVLKSQVIRYLNQQIQMKLKIQNIFLLFQKKIHFQNNAFLTQLKKLSTTQNNPHLTFQNKLLDEISHNRLIQKQNLKQKSFIFSLNEFSQIIPYTIDEEQEQSSTSRINDIQQIDSKFKPLSVSKLQILEQCQQNNNQQLLMMRSFQKLKQQVGMMKNLLYQKNRQIKFRDQQISKIKRDYEKRIQELHDRLSEKIQNQFQHGTTQRSQSKKNQLKTSGYFKQLQDHIIGDRSPRGQQDQDGNHINEQLLQKYMKESFEMRQKMDIAREMCEQFQFDSRTDEGQIMYEIIKLLTPEERLHSFVD